VIDRDRVGVAVGYDEIGFAIAVEIGITDELRAGAGRDV
jgi:hypothetical protein